MPLSAELRALKADLEHAPDYATWREIALMLDYSEGLDAWRAADPTDDYDYQLVKARLTELKRMRRQKKDVRRLVFALHEGLHGNLGGMANPMLYTHCRVGTKLLIHDYIDEVARALDWICDTPFDDFSTDDKIVFFKRTGHSFGRSALMLSGGATFGMFHAGVVRALFKEGVLPRVFSGSSAGSIVAGMACSRTDEEFMDAFDPAVMNLDAWQRMDMRSALRNRALMSSDTLANCLRDNIGDYTFEEAFERTGRILGVTVSPAERFQHGRLLNYLTAPSVLIWSASQASSAVPGLFAPVALKAKSYDGAIVDYMPTKRWSDGSLASDLPMMRLARLHNVNHYIVSQTNPHVVPLLSDERKRGLLPFARDVVTKSAQQTIGLAKQHFGESPAGAMLKQVNSLTSQRYTGDITVAPSYSPKQYMRMLSNPTTEEMRQYIREGERCTWQYIERTSVQTRISRTFEECLLKLKAVRFGRRKGDAPLRLQSQRSEVS